MTTLQFLRIHRLTRCIHELRLLQQHLHCSMKNVSSPSPRFISFGQRLLVKGDDFLSFNRGNKLTEECGGVSVDESYFPIDVAQNDDVIGSKTSVSRLKCDEKSDREDGSKTSVTSLKRDEKSDELTGSETSLSSLTRDIGRHIDTSLAEKSNIAIETKSQISDINTEQSNVTMNTGLPTSELSTAEETKVTMETISPTSEESEVAMGTSLPTKEVTKEQTNVIMDTKPSTSEQNKAAMETRPPTSEQSEVAMETRPATIKKFEPTFTVAPLVYESKTLQKLVALGMDLSRLDKYDCLADSIVQLDFEKDVTPYLLFLKDLGVADLGRYLSRNPLVFRQSLDDLNVRVRYLMSKKFDSDSVTRIVSRAPLFLSLPVTTVDRKLGFLQRSFHLTGNEVREVATKLPKIITWKLDKIKENRKYIHEFLGFTNIELKKMILIYPKIFLMDKHAVGKKFDFLHNTMGLDHKRLLEWPPVFGTRLHVIKSRHLYLLRVGRAQYNPGAENFVSLKRLCSGRDGEFCVDVARTSVKEYNEFLKCL